MAMAAGLCAVRDAASSVDRAFRVRRVKTLPSTAEEVPGALCRPNSHRTDLLIAWLVDEPSRSVWLADWIDDDRVGPAGDRAYQMLDTLLPEPPARPIATAEALHLALEGRFTAHPLANQVSSAVTYAEEALAAGVDAGEVMRVALRWACPGGVGRALGAALSRGGDNTHEDLASLRRLARACLVLELTTLDAQGSSDRPHVGAATHALLLDAPEVPYPEGKHPRHDGCEQRGVALEYDRLSTLYYRRAQSFAEHVLALPNERFDTPYAYRPPVRLLSSEAAIRAVHLALEGRSESAVKFALRSAMDGLRGQSYAAIRPTLVWLLSAIAPIEESFHARNALARVASEGKIVCCALQVFLETDQDLEAVARAREEARACAEAEREAGRRAAEEAAEKRLDRRVVNALRWVLQRGIARVGLLVFLGVLLLLALWLRGLRL